MLKPTTTHSIVRDNPKKVYPRRDGNKKKKMAMRGLSLLYLEGSVSTCSVPNGARKTLFISMVSTLFYEIL